MVIVATPTMNQTPLMKLIVPNIVQALQPTSLIVGASARLQDNWNMPTSQNINAAGSSVELTAILGGDTQNPAVFFDCRDGFGTGVAATWDGTNISFIINAGAGDAVINASWVPVSNAAWKFIWRKSYRAIIVNNSILAENFNSFDLPANVGSAMLVAQSLNCQLISLRIERSTPI
jgi:hypothetical protein